MKIGIFGGSFNPPHMGHINAIQTVAKKAGLGKVHIIPAAQNPLKTPVEGPTPEQRVELTRLAFAQYGETYFVDDQEIKRGGMSYTIDTVMNLRKSYDANDLYLVVGADKFEELAQWKDYQKILTEANLIVTTRPGYDMPESLEEMPGFLKPLVAEFDFNFIELNTGRNIQFITLRDVEVSSSEVRKWLRSGKPVEKYLPLSVESYIKENKLYRNLGDRIGDYTKFTEFCANVLFAKKGINVRGFDLTQMSAPSEYTLIASGTSTRHAAAMAENIVMAVKEEYNVHPQSIEGVDEGRWVLVDYGSLIIHVFYDFVRQEYNLENLWREGKDMGLKDPYVGKGEQ
ncbi:nicotinate (nicotinamide) nucleotide adenylyltransferase [Bdellovibrio bacteriovorus]|uniref:nicotinate (nicotinamide) nucleotide adenylyltransferase n=1 Tax=Bdellovibrio bacteriovorus TaxID=959 RepID=UPI00045BFC72|nr:nicotinate (nicotinamide) nucleotide adenylyltransferase [Bdellovibrio bacteriovorus]AHZ85598.1 nicotinate-nucleotide adenylyltransferase [Bdellovibrio bacteriovorus]BEV70144.1 nicotinate-nucleotide adenylyltransferase [Bdellovibrio bacteriovorus]